MDPDRDYDYVEPDPDEDPHIEDDYDAWNDEGRPTREERYLAEWE